MFLSDLGYSYRVEGSVCYTHLTVGDELRGDGSKEIRASVLATLSDIVGGALAHRAISGRVPLTVDLSVHRLAAGGVTELEARGNLLKPGRGTVVTETWFTQRGEERPFAVSSATFVPSPNPAHVLELDGDTFETRPGLHRSLPDQLGVRPLAAGIAELDRTDYVTQDSGTIQGGALALLAEVAAESLTGRPVAEMEVRFLSAVRVGPARAVAELHGSDVVRVEVRDRGQEDRLATLILARVLSR